jgi:hypothetical protein
MSSSKLFAALVFVLTAVTMASSGSAGDPSSGNADPPWDETDQQKVGYLTKYAPRVWIHSKESYWPSSVEWSFNFLKREWSDDLNGQGGWRLTTTDELEEASSCLAYFHGADPRMQLAPPSLGLKVPAYAFWHQVDDRTVDLLYFFYYPYNRGKNILGTVFGNHVGDWEHVTVRLYRQQDTQGRWTLEPFTDPVEQNVREGKVTNAGIPEDAGSFYHAYHTFGKTHPWTAVPKVPDTQHPVIYSALGSHGVWLIAGEHDYDDKFRGDKILKAAEMSATAVVVIEKLLGQLRVRVRETEKQIKQLFGEKLTGKIIGGLNKVDEDLQKATKQLGYVSVLVKSFRNPSDVKLVDKTDEGTRWDTWTNLECFDYDAKNGLGPTWKGTWPMWLKKDTADRQVGNEDPASGPVYRWGNKKMEVGGPVAALGRAVDDSVIVLDDGPIGPADKDYFDTPELD